MKSERKNIIYGVVLTLLLLWTSLGTALSVPRLPEPELAWKNMVVGGKKLTVFCIYTDSRGMAWIGTNSGLYFYDGIATHPIAESKLSGTQIYSIVERDGCLYLGGNNGLFAFRFDTNQLDSFESVSPKEIRSLLMVDQTLWIGSLYGMYTFNTQTRQLRNLSLGLPHKSVYSLLRDSRGVLYVGTYNGLARWDSSKKAFRKVEVATGGADQRHVFVNCLLEDDDEKAIYVGGEGMLYRYSPVVDTWTRVEQMDGNNVKSLAKTQAGHLLIGTDNGVFELNGDAVRHYRHDSRLEQSLSDNEIWCIYSDTENNVWAGHGKGFSIAANSSAMRTVTLSTLARSGEGNDIYSICRDSYTNLWLGGTNGIIRLSEGKAPVWYRHSDAEHSLSHNRIRAITEDSEGTVWLSTDGGINRYNRSKASFDVFHVVDQNGNHNSNWVYAIQEDGDSLWVGSYLGGLHYVAKDKFGASGGEVVAGVSVNNENKRFGQLQVDLKNDLINNVVRDADGNVWILLFRDNSLTKLSPGKGCVKYDILTLTGNYPTHIALDALGRLWCAFKGGAVVFGRKGNSQTVKLPNTEGDEGVLAMGAVGRDMWISTLSNVWRVDGKTLEVTLLPIPQKAYTALYNDTATGKVYLGGTDEILEVDPDDLKDVSGRKAIRMLLQKKGADGYVDLSGLNEGNRLVIPHGGSVTLLVSTLDYSPESVQRYMYKLAKTPADTLDGWVVMPEASNTITLSDLSMGRYTLLVKTVGSPVTPLSAPLVVEGPWLLSWWAVALYILFFIGLVVGIIEYSRRRNLKILREKEREKALENVEKKLTFLSDISHDLKTPLSMILGPVSVLKEHAKDSKVKKTLELIYENAVRLNNLIHRTLELNHLEDTDEDLLILSTFDVVEFCKEVFETYRENNPQKNFVFHSSCQQLLIEADAVKFESVIANLLSNACKYSEDGATVSCGIRTNNGMVEIVVSDDGLGIAETDQSLVFQRMFRSPSTAKLREGTGIGLYLIKKYLDLMKGNINLYSREGQGSSFIVTLPLSEELMQNSPSGESEENADNGKPKVLIVEDNRQISLFIRDLLKKDYTCLQAENGRAGLSIASSFVPDLILLDEMMPIMRGSEMVRRLKQNPRLSLIPIIMLTAKADNFTETESVKLGIDAFMSKPFEPSVLLGRVSQLIKARSDLRESVRIESITETKPIKAESVNEKLLAKIAKIVEENISDPDLTVNFLSEKSGLPNKQLYRIIKKYMGVGPLDYIRRVRLQKAAMLLAQHRFTVAEISYMVGFKTPSYFAKCFQAQFGVKPSQYQSEDANTSMS